MVPSFPRASSTNEIFSPCVCVCVLSSKQYYLSPLSSFYMNNLLFHPFGLTHRTAVGQSHRETKMSHNENGICSTNQPDLHSNEFINVIKSVLLRCQSGFPTHLLLWVLGGYTGPLLSILSITQYSCPLITSASTGQNDLQSRKRQNNECTFL